MCYAQMISESMKKARKDHICAGCHKKISSGTKYMRSVSKVDGDFSSSALCVPCIAAFEVDLSTSDDSCVYYGLQGLTRHALVEDLGWRSALKTLREAMARVKAQLTRRSNESSE